MKYIEYSLLYDFYTYIYIFSPILIYIFFLLCARLKKIFLTKIFGEINVKEITALRLQLLQRARTGERADRFYFIVGTTRRAGKSGGCKWENRGRPWPAAEKFKSEGEPTGAFAEKLGAPARRGRWEPSRCVYVDSPFSTRCAYTCFTLLILLFPTLPRLYRASRRRILIVKVT